MPDRPDAAARPASSADSALAERVRMGDATAFADIVRMYFNGAEYVAYRLLHSRDAAKDCVQQVLTRVWELRASFQPTHSVKSYLFGATRKQALMELRRQSVRDGVRPGMMRSSPADLASHGGDALAELDAVSVGSEEDVIVDRVTIERLLAQLPDRARLALQLRFLEQLSYAELGEVLEVTPGAAEQLVIRALAKLRERPRRRAGG